MRGLELNETLDRVVNLLMDRLDLTLDQFRAIAAEVDGIQDVEEKNRRILHLASKIPCGPINPVYLPNAQPPAIDAMPPIILKNGRHSGLAN